MHRLILLGFVAVAALPALGAKKLTVAQLERELSESSAAHRSDLDAAREVGHFEMAERLTDDRLNRFAATLKLGPRTALALQLLSDQSAFLDPPADELPATAPPDSATQQKMLDAARAYAVQTWSRMPSFFVTRVTNRFDDAPHALGKGDWPVDLGLQPAGQASRKVTFRDGKEAQDTDSSTNAQQTQEEVGLRSWGEFGPALSVVLGDTARNPLTFSHWETTRSGLAAVFSYSVPRDASHYQVTYGYRSQTVIGRTQFGYSGNQRTVQQVASIPREQTYQTYSENPAYHGTISIDPATGAVMRLTIQAGLKTGDPLLLAETMVQYGPVKIGDRQFICPIRSLAISATDRKASAGPMALNGVGDTSAWGNQTAQSGKSTVLMINESQFADYHRLGSTVRILTDAAATPQAPSAGAESGESAPVPGSTEPSPSSVATASAPPSETPLVASVASPEAASAPPTSAPAPPAKPVIPEVSMADANNLPDRPSGEQDAHDANTFSLKVTSRLVDVGLVAYDKKGHPVNDLQASDLEIYDNGQRKDIRSFALASAAPEVSTTPADAHESPSADSPEPSFSNRVSNSAAAPATSSISDVGATILVIDESHIAWNDMSLTRGQILKFLASLAPGERVGLYSMNGLGFRVLTEVTTDHAVLIARMQKFMPSAQSVSEAQEEETRNRQQFDEVHNVADLNSVNGNHADVPDSSTPIDPQLMTMGDVRHVRLS